MSQLFWLAPCLSPDPAQGPVSQTGEKQTQPTGGLPLVRGQRADAVPQAPS